ncbi:MAG: AEC family transporter [Ruminococcaceae bacterium]|nr:AEC family transporter [Oscillospiraceae bacterium]
MENFLLALSVIFPIFVNLALGYVMMRFKILDDNSVKKINASVFKVFLPLLLFYNIYSTNIESALKPKLMLFAVLSIVILFFVLLFVIPLIEKDNKKVGPIIQGIFRSNFVIFGIPVATLLCTADDIGATSLLVAVVVPLFNVLAVFVMEFFRGEKVNFKNVLKGVITNPLIIASILGLVFAFLNIKMPSILVKSISDVAKIATPLALIALGASFTFKSVKGYIKQIIIGVLGKLVIVPFILLSVAVMLGFRNGDLVSLMVLYASPAAVSSFVMAQQMDADALLAGHFVVLGSIFSIFTVFMWILILKTLMLI